MSFTKDLQQAIKRDPRSLRGIARDAGIAPIQITRFLRNERTLRTPAVDGLCEALGLKLAPKKQRQVSCGNCESG